MAKYVIAREMDGRDTWFAYRTIFGMWGWMTVMTNTCGFTAERCETRLRAIVDKSVPKMKRDYYTVEIK